MGTYGHQVGAGAGAWRSCFEKGLSGTRAGVLGQFSYKIPVVWKRTVVKQGEAHYTRKFLP